jgi:hypothetical protein
MEREYYLQKILGHPLFRKSKRQRELLLYLFQNSISEDRKDIKELTLAIDIYGEAPCFDPGSKGYVRVAVYKLRRKLEEYYSLDGRFDRIRLSIPRGKYCVEFSRISGALPCHGSEGIRKLSFFQCE